MRQRECFYLPAFSLYLGVHILSSNHETTSPHAAGEGQGHELQAHLAGKSPPPTSIASVYHQPFSPEVLQKE